MGNGYGGVKNKFVQNLSHNPGTVNNGGNQRPKKREEKNTLSILKLYEKIRVYIS